MKTLILITGALWFASATFAQQLPVHLQDKAPVNIFGDVVQANAGSIKVSVVTHVPQYNLVADTRLKRTVSVPNGYKDAVTYYLVRNYPSSLRPVNVGDSVQIRGVEDQPFGTMRTIYYISGGGPKNLQLKTTSTTSTTTTSGRHKAATTSTTIKTYSVGVPDTESKTNN